MLTMMLLFIQSLAPLGSLIAIAWIEALLATPCVSSRLNPASPSPDSEASILQALVRLAGAPAAVALPYKSATLPPPPHSAAHVPCLPDPAFGVDPAPVVSPSTSHMGGVATEPSAGLLAGAPQGCAGATTSRRRLATWRGSLELCRERRVGPPREAISTISMLRKGLLGLTCADQRGMRPMIACAIGGILEAEDSFCVNEVAKIREAVH